jgi:hypothetical protein
MLYSMFAMCCFRIPITIFGHFAKSGRKFLWVKMDINVQGKCLEKWELVCRPKDQGEPGILNLSLLNQAILIKKYTNLQSS